MELIYKYVSPERIDILENLQLRVTQPKYLNDPFDITFPFKQDYKSLKEFYKKYPGLKPRKSKISLLEIIRGFYGVLSFTKSPDNIPMWAHYSSVHTGFVIVFNADHKFFNRGLTEADPMFSKSFQMGTLEKVNYYTEKTFYKDFGESYHKPYLFEKHEIWEYENEWRMILPLTITNLKKYKDIYLIDIPADLIQGIIFGINCNHDLINYVKRLKHEKLNHLKLNKTKVDLRKYKMDIMEESDTIKLKNLKEKINFILENPKLIKHTNIKPLSTN